jgi:hypothetical protein
VAFSRANREAEPKPGDLEAGWEEIACIHAKSRVDTGLRLLVLYLQLHLTLNFVFKHQQLKNTPIIVIGLNKNKLKLVESLGADLLIDRSGVGKITLAIG